jgi:hypothetical protein
LANPFGVANGIHGYGSDIRDLSRWPNLGNLELVAKGSISEAWAARPG